MHEKLIDDWLTNVNELGYQIPFCEALVAEGYSVIHVSTHGRGEHGKDIVARRPDGRLATFQLKGGDLRLSEWRGIRGEVEELVQLPVRLPGIDESEEHIPHLVTNGEIRGDAMENIVRYSESWQRHGYQKLQVWSRREVLRKFLDAQGSFLPGGLKDFRRFVELYVRDFESPLPKAKLARLLEGISASNLGNVRGRELRRATAGLALVAGYIAEQFERAKNYLAAAEGWVMAAAAIMHVAEREKLTADIYESSLSLLYTALRRTLDHLAEEVLGTENFSSYNLGLADPHVYGVRVCLTLGWLSAWALDRKWRREERVDTQALMEVIAREYPAHRLAGEVDWPFLLCLVLYLDKEWMQADAEAITIQYARTVISANLGQEAAGLPSPYWSHEKVLKYISEMLPANDRETFGTHSYTVRQAMDVLVRRLRRQAVRVMWPSASKLMFCDFVPDSPADYFLWRCKAGNLRTIQPRNPASWAQWRAESGALDRATVPSVLLDNPEWVLPFLLTYPHRANRSLCALAETVTSGRVTLV